MCSSDLKTYGALKANDCLSLSVKPGEIHAVLGENGAGKSTLMKIIYGSVRPDSGVVLWNGEPVALDGPGSARRLGIGMVHQHFALFESVTVAENVACALDGPMDLNGLSERIVALSKTFRMKLDPGRLLFHLSMGERQQVEIIRCLLQDPKLLILDEPTSVLTPQAAKDLFVTLKSIAAAGCSIIYISHKLEEVRYLCHSASVLRRGKLVASANPAEVSAADLACLMVGSELPAISRQPSSPQRPCLEAIGLSLPRQDLFGVDLRDVNLHVRAGELVGIAGISGNGQKELFAAITGERECHTRDAILIDSTPAGRLDAGQRRALGLASVPEDRLGRGAVPTMSLSLNALLTAHAEGLVEHGVVRRDLATTYAERVIDTFDVRCLGAQSQAQSLSGGNLQKFILGREIRTQPKVLVASQPTWGVDVAAAAFIRQQLLNLSREGSAVLVFSDELEELLEVCDRLYVMHSGQLSVSLDASTLDATTIGLMMAGDLDITRDRGEDNAAIQA